jgi:thymidylate synthase
MYYREFEGVNAFLVGMAQLLLKEGIERKTRGYKCFELPTPFVAKIINPTARLITVPARNWNFTLPYVESLWLASGRNDIQMVAYYVKKMLDFSDDQSTMRAGYGPRLRYFNGIADDYNTGFVHEHLVTENAKTVEIDQFEFVEKSFHKDPFTRQAIISIGDPAKDCFTEEHELKKTKDFPCTRDIQFIRNDNKLDLIVHMRSNDFVWGATGVNLFNFTFMQEYFARILGLEIGHYYHMVNNFHYYEDFKDMLNNIANTAVPKDIPFEYPKSFRNLKEFDERLLVFQRYEHQLRKNQTDELIDFDDDFFNDWAKVLSQFNKKPSKKIPFASPVLQQIANAKMKKQAVLNNKEQLKEAFVSDQQGNNPVYWRQYI